MLEVMVLFYQLWLCNFYLGVHLMSCCHRVFKKIALPIRTISRAGGLLFSLNQGLILFSVSGPISDLLVPIYFATAFSVVTYRARKTQVDDFFDKKLTLSAKEGVDIHSSKAIIFFKTCNYVTMLGLQISGILSGWAISDALVKLLKLFSQPPEKVILGLHGFGLIAGVLAGACVALIYLAFQGKETEKYVVRLFAEKEELNKKALGKTLFLGLFGSLAIALFAYFSVYHGLDKLLLVFSQIFNISASLKNQDYVLVKQVLSILVGIATFFSMGLSNNMAVYDFIAKPSLAVNTDSCGVCKKIGLLVLKSSFAVGMFFQFFSATADTLIANFYSEKINLVNTPLKTEFLLWSVSALIGFSGSLLFYIFNRKGFTGSPPQTATKASLLSDDDPADSESLVLRLDGSAQFGPTQT